MLMLNCRSCQSPNVSSIIPLGSLPLANALLSELTTEKEPRYNLEVMHCADCGLAQLKDLIDPKDLFSDYVYFSSNSDAMLSSAKALVDKIMPSLKEGAFVIEIASNDGYLLKNYIKAGINALGIDPAANIAKAANDQGVPTLCDFFGESLAHTLVESGKRADVIHANNVMAHVPDINGFIKGLQILLKQDGKAIIEVPYFMDLVKKLEFDTIYHEHVYYFSVGALKVALERQGLEIFDIEKIQLHGGSLRLSVGHKARHDIAPFVQTMIEDEIAFGLNEPKTFHQFMERLLTLKADLRNTLIDLKQKDSKIAAYGASAKGTTLLNFFGIGKDLIEFVVDRSPAKKGKFTPGTQLEIFYPPHLIEKDISHALLLTWNFADEIIDQQKEFVKTGGSFIVPVPTVKVL